MTDFTKLIAQQLRLAKAKRGLGTRVPQAAPAKPDEVLFGPCALFSRECGSAGDAVAEAVGARLHWPVYNREIVEQIAQRAHVGNQLVESVDEHVRSSWRRLLHPIRERETLKPETYLYHLHEIVLAIGHHGYAVIVGRGAQFLWPSEGSVRVRVVEAFRGRVQRIAAARQIAIEEATQFVQRRDAERSEFIRKVFSEDTTAPLNYDLVLNTGQMDVEVATLTVLATMEMKLGVKVEPVPCTK